MLKHYIKELLLTLMRNILIIFNDCHDSKIRDRNITPASLTQSQTPQLGAKKTI